LAFKVSLLYPYSPRFWNHINQSHAHFASVLIPWLNFILTFGFVLTESAQADPWRLLLEEVKLDTLPCSGSPLFGGHLTWLLIFDNYFFPLVLLSPFSFSFARVFLPWFVFMQ
jgi:hypothetical protein